mmetsp:Transcript_9882/g.23741  ORF Transcript_9882/g.23741 Transcript_9882/m.23741 type:complete len:112 (-) Transcript_9882:144-479(-)
MGACGSVEAQATEAPKMRIAQASPLERDKAGVNRSSEKLSAPKMQKTQVSPSERGKADHQSPEGKLVEQFLKKEGRLGERDAELLRTAQRPRPMYKSSSYDRPMQRPMRRG